MMTKKTILSFLATFIFLAAHAQSTPEMADTMRQSGKIYVVVFVIVALFAGLLIYLFNTDRKISRLEKEMEILKQSNK
jgi:hypothetical protein